MASKRIQELDALRGLAAMAVVLFHFSFRYYELFGESGVSGVDSADPGGLFRTGYLGVHLFFIVSGFVIFMTVDRTESPVDFVFSRFSRLYPTYWAGVLVTTLVVALGWLPNMRRTFGEVLVNLTMLHEFWGVRPVEGVYWTLTRELIFYGIVLTVFSLGLIRFWIPLAYSWLAIQSAANLAMWFVGDFPYRLRFWLLTEFCHLFVAGMAFYEIQKSQSAQASVKLQVQDPSTKRAETLAAYGLVVFAAVNHFIVEARDLPASRFEEGIYIIAFFVIMLAIVHRKAQFIAIKPLVFLGGISYALYLVHQFLGYSIMQAFERNDWPLMLAVGISTLLSVLLATAMTRFIEQPSLQFLRRWYKQLKSTAATQAAADSSSSGGWERELVGHGLEGEPAEGSHVLSTQQVSDDKRAIAEPTSSSTKRFDPAEASPVGERSKEADRDSLPPRKPR